ncbi:hypothetical protein HMPREF9440_00507 [Sutterella parvirubra YIT 11816]|uniref:Uncharacterized protein n=1 Tax=Sutterella parvirubra YIT 11816 TaxID=762967 RepID=H3KCQ4_9BURK|nr:hypothetical protein HMPREF9440_00507 [Sutterella parvirubra YIT 11816]
MSVRRQREETDLFAGLNPCARRKKLMRHTASAGSRFGEFFRKSP